MGIYTVAGAKIIIKTWNLAPLKSRTVSTYSMPTTAPDNYPIPSTSTAYNASQDTRRFTAHSAVSVGSVETVILATFRWRFFQKVIFFMVAYLAAWFLPSLIFAREWSASRRAVATEFMSSHDATAMALDDVPPIPGATNAELAIVFIRSARGIINFMCYFLVSCWSLWRDRRTMDKWFQASS
jgi:hypothetical protein